MKTYRGFIVSFVSLGAIYITDFILSGTDGGVISNTQLGITVFFMATFLIGFIVQAKSFKEYWNNKDIHKPEKVESPWE